MLDKTVLDVFGMSKQPPEGRFGVEIEMEGENLPDKLTGWQLKEEHSLRGESREFATNGAVSIGDLKARLFTVAKALGKEGVKVNTSYRGSTHIHYNVQNETLRTVFNEWVIFTAIEPVFLALIGGQRNGNLFCMPSYDTGDALMAFYNQLYNTVRGSGKWTERGKYAARNADPVRRFGSVEYRFFPPETGDRIITWCQYLDKLWEMARLYTDATSLHKAVREYRSDPSVFLSIFPETELPPRHVIPNISGIGAELAYELSRKYVLLTKEGKTKDAPLPEEGDEPWIEEPPLEAVQNLRQVLPPGWVMREDGGLRRVDQPQAAPEPNVFERAADRFRRR